MSKSPSNLPPLSYDGVAVDPPAFLCSVCYGELNSQSGFYPGGRCCKTCKDVKRRGGATPVLEAELERLLLRALDAGWPQWNINYSDTSLDWSRYPPNSVEYGFSFYWSKLKYCARIDFFRGTPEEDFENSVWVSDFLDHMPTFDKSFWQGGSSMKQRGNKMEAAAGVAYAAATDCRFLPAKVSDLKFPSEQSQRAWAAVWNALESLGLGPTANCTEEHLGSSPNTETLDELTSNPQTQSVSACKKRKSSGCALCEVYFVKLTECIFCSSLVCKKHAFWCTLKPCTWSVCAECQKDESSKLVRRGRLWLCPDHL